MKAVTEGITTTVRDCVEVINKMDEIFFSSKPAPDKWSKKEIVGHLVDSAQNNLQRFVRTQYEENPRIVYAQDDWVRIQHYQSCDSRALLQLWTALNDHLCNVLVNMPPESYEATCDVGKSAVDKRTLKFLAEDYLVHMRHHVQQIVSGK